jgi:hypothetical protein
MEVGMPDDNLDQQSEGLAIQMERRGVDKSLIAKAVPNATVEQLALLKANDHNRP